MTNDLNVLYTVKQVGSSHETVEKQKNSLNYAVSCNRSRERL